MLNCIVKYVGDSELNTFGKETFQSKGKSTSRCMHVTHSPTHTGEEMEIYIFMVMFSGRDLCVLSLLSVRITVLVLLAML